MSLRIEDGNNEFSTADFLSRGMGSDCAPKLIKELNKMPPFLQKTALARDRKARSTNRATGDHLLFTEKPL